MLMLVAKFTNRLTHRAMSVCIVQPASEEDPQLHPRERRIDEAPVPLRVGGRRRRALGCGCAAPRGGRARRASAGAPIGPGGIPLARRDHPVTLPIYSDNEPIGSGKNTEKGPLNVFNWSAYINPSVVKEFEKQYKVKVNITTFENEEEALAKLTSGQAQLRRLVRDGEYLSRAVAGQADPAGQPLVPAEPARTSGRRSRARSTTSHSRYSVPYMVYTTGIAWRTRQGQDAADVVQERPTTSSGTRRRYAGKVAILDDQREAIGMALLHRGVTDVNTENPQLVKQAAADLCQVDEDSSTSRRTRPSTPTSRPARRGSARRGRATWPARSTTCRRAFR